MPRSLIPSLLALGLPFSAAFAAATPASSGTPAGSATPPPPFKVQGGIPNLTLTPFPEHPPITIERPFLLMSKTDAAALKARLTSDPDTKAQYDRMVAYERGKGTRKNATNPEWMDLFDIVVLGDAAAVARQMGKLLSNIKRPPITPAQLARLRDPANLDPGSANEHLRDDRTLDALRYDSLYHYLTPAERTAVETCLRVYVQFHLEWPNNWDSWSDNPRTAWLPNMQWPRAAGTLVAAVALADPVAIETMFASKGGWKWYFDDYLAGEGWYNEEYGKYFSNIGAMIMYCEGLERLKLGKFGYGYTGAKGATMRGHLESNWRLGLPRTDNPDGSWSLLRVTMGDARSGFAHALVHSEGSGMNKHSPEGTLWWGGGRMNGDIQKMLGPLWAEFIHRRFPDSGLDWFVAQFQAPTTKVLPTLYAGLPAFAPSAAKAPAWPSIVSKDRNFALLKMDETSAYWDSPRPALAVQFGSYYVHYVHDAFSGLQYVANQRVLYTSLGGVEQNYAGGSPWADSMQGHWGIVVDGEQVQPVDDGNHGTQKTAVRQSLHPASKFVAVQAKGLYKDLDWERLWVLGDACLVEVNRLRSPRPRGYDYNVHAVGFPAPEANATWNDSKDLDGHKRWLAPVADAGAATMPAPISVAGNAALSQSQMQISQRLKVGPPYQYDLRNTRKLDPGSKTWSLRFAQRAPVAGETAFTGPSTGAPLSPTWTAKKAGVRLTMLGNAPTVAYTGETPCVGTETKGGKLDHRPPVCGATTLVARRIGTDTAFVTVHEPYVADAPKLDRIRLIAETADGVVVAVNDLRICLAYATAAGKPLTLEGEGERFVFTGYARIDASAVTPVIEGELSAGVIVVGGKTVTVR